MMHISITVINMMIIAEQVLTELSSTTEQSVKSQYSGYSVIYLRTCCLHSVVLSNLVKSQYIGYSTIYLMTCCLAVQ